MKKTSIGFLVAAAALILSGCGNQATQNQNANQAQNQDQSQASESNENAVINSIKDALKSGKKMECTYTTKIGDKEIKAIMQTDGQNFKSTSELDGRKINTVMKDEVSYTWGEGVPMAGKLAMSCIKDLPQGQGGEATAQAQDPEKSFESAANVVCKSVATVDVSVPSNVQFQDMCEMMKGVQNMQIPSGANMPNIPNIPEQK
jgi:transglutaminase/protease-like cytokinesis protein 3